MHGPVWKPGFGVTGERNINPNYETIERDGKTVTLVGAAAEEHRGNGYGMPTGYPVPGANLDVAYDSAVFTASRET